MNEAIGYETIMCSCGHETTVEHKLSGQKRTRYPKFCKECTRQKNMASCKAYYRKRKEIERAIRLSQPLPPPPPKKWPDRLYIPPPKVTTSYLQDLQIGSKFIDLCNKIAQGKLSIAGVR